MKVLVIPEDPTLGQYILKPIIGQILTDIGARSPRIEVLTNPRLRGVAQALDPSVVDEIVEDNPMIDLFLVLIDRDGNKNRQSWADALERNHGNLFCCLAIEEIEVWMLAVHRESLADRWSDIRAEHHPKERFAIPFLEERFPALGVGEARRAAMREVGKRWRGVLQVCPELEELKRRLNAQRIMTS